MRRYFGSKAGKPQCRDGIGCTYRWKGPKGRLFEIKTSNLKLDGDSPSYQFSAEIRLAK